MTTGHPSIHWYCQQSTRKVIKFRKLRKLNLCDCQHWTTSKGNWYDEWIYIVNPILPRSCAAISINPLFLFQGECSLIGKQNRLCRGVRRRTSFPAMTAPPMDINGGGADLTAKYQVFLQTCQIIRQLSAWTGLDDKSTRKNIPIVVAQSKSL